MTLVWGPEDTSTVRPVTDTTTVRCPHNGHYQRSDFSPHKTYPCMSYVAPMSPELAAHEPDDVSAVDIEAA